jgi:hypothetical protein
VRHHCIETRSPLRLLIEEPALHPTAERQARMAATQEAVEMRRTLAAQRPDAFWPGLAASLNNLANMLSALSRGEEALAAALEAVDMYCALAAQRPDAFRPDLAISLAVLAICLDGIGRHEDAVAANAEAMATLSDAFRRHPAAFAGQVRHIVREYIERCEKLGREPDTELLAPVLAVFQALQADGGEGESRSTQLSD